MLVEMKVLIVASGNSGNISPFVKEQAEALRRNNIEIRFFMIRGKSIFGYIRNYIPLVRVIKDYKPDLVHAHYGLSGLLANFQRKVPVITTFHGSDINSSKTKYFSLITSKLSSKSIFVNRGLADNISFKRPYIIPCGIELDIFCSINKFDARKELGFSKDEKYILFSSSFSKPVKNYFLAKIAMTKIPFKNVKLIELKGYNRNEVALLMNAVDVVLLTSLTEGSPQFIKEAMACNSPIVSTDVGDVRNIIGKTEGCYITSFNPDDVASKIKKAIEFGKKTTGRDSIKNFESGLIAKKIINIYRLILQN